MFDRTGDAVMGRVRHMLSAVSLVLGGVISMTAAGCASGGLPVVAVAEANRLVASDYRLEPGDRLRVTVFDEPSLTGEYQIGVGGNVTLPLISDVVAARQTPQSLAQEIAAKLKAGDYVLAPRVAVDVLSHRPIYVLGEVNRPGEYPYQGDLTFHQAIAKAGGFTPRADRRTIELQRFGMAFSGVIKLDRGSSLMIAPGDTIIIRESFF